jgi:hypothetical protein
MPRWAEQEARAPVPRQEARQASLGRRVDALFGARRSAAPPIASLAALAARIDWDASPPRLQAGDLAGLDGPVADAIRRIAAEPFVVREARNAGCDPVVLVIALLAKTVARRSRTADRIARTLIGERPTGDIFGEIDRLMRSW